MNSLTVKLFATISLMAAATATAIASPTTFANVGQTDTTKQFSLSNSGGVVTLTAAGTDFFTFLVGGTPFGAPVLANFLLNAVSTQTGSCGSAGCPANDSFTQQGYVGSFSYRAVGGVYDGALLLGGTFSVNGDPTNSGGKLGATVSNSAASFNAGSGAGDPNGLVLSSDFLTFAGTTNQSASWALSGLSPSFATNVSGGTTNLPQDGTTFLAANASTFASEPAPTALGAPEPMTISLLGSALLGFGLIRRRRFTAKP